MFESKSDTNFGAAPQALLCLEDEESVATFAAICSEFGFRPSGCAVERDIVLAMRNEKYDLVVLPAVFGTGDITSNYVLNELAGMNSEDRRHQFCVLVGRNLHSGDHMAAFRLSVDLVLNEADLAGAKDLIEQGLARKQRNLFAYTEMLQMVGAG